MSTKEVVNRLKTLLSDGDEVDRCYAIQSLVTMQHSGANELLETCLRDEDIDVCVDAANALGELGDHGSASSLLASLLNDPDGEVKTACIQALSSLQEREAIPHLLNIIEHRPEDISFNSNDWDQWWDMQLESIRAMGTMRVPEAVPVLQRLLDSEDYLDIEDEIFKTLARIGVEGDTLLVELLETGKPRTRRRVARALANSNSMTTLKSLGMALRDSEAEVRDAALKALVKREKAISYLPIILHLFRDADAEVRKTAIEVAEQLVQSMGNDPQKDFPDLAEKLLPMLEDEDPRVKSAVLDTLSSLDWQSDRKTREIIVQMLSQCSGDGFKAVCRYITRYQLIEAIDDMVLLIRKNALEEEEKQAAIIALGRLQQWNPKIELLLGSALFDESKIVRLAALEALAQLEASHTATSASSEADLRMPLEMIKQALQGKLDPPLSQQKIPVSIAASPAANEQETADEMQEEHAADIEFTASENNEFLDNALEEISKSLKAGETPVPLSTLDSIAVSCVEKQLEAEAKAEQDAPQQSTLSSEDQQALQGFLDITQANADTAKWLFNREQVSVELDIQRLAARILGNIGSSHALPLLLEALSADDSELRREASLSIGRLAHKYTLSSTQSDQLQDALLAALDDENRDLRIAALRVLGEFGNPACIDKLTASAQDQEVSVRIHGIHALSLLVQRTALKDQIIHTLLEHLLGQMNSKDTGVNRAVMESVIPLLARLNSEAGSLKQSAINRLIDAGLAGSDGQVREMSHGLSKLDQQQASTCLIERLDRIDSSIERRYVVEMLGELNRPATAA